MQQPLFHTGLHAIDLNKVLLNNTLTRTTRITLDCSSLTMLKYSINPRLKIIEAIYIRQKQSCIKINYSFQPPYSSMDILKKK